MSERGLAELRTKLDTINKELLSLLGERYQIVDQIGSWKAQNGLAIHDPDRVQFMLEELRLQWQAEQFDPALWPVIEGIFLSIFDSAMEYQTRR